MAIPRRTAKPCTAGSIAPRTARTLRQRPPHKPTPRNLYVARATSVARLGAEPLIAEPHRDEPKSVFYSCDVRGIGESRPDTCGQNQFLTPYGSDYFYSIH